MKFRIVLRKTITLERTYYIESVNALRARRVAKARANANNADEMCGLVPAEESNWRITESERVEDK